MQPRLVGCTKCRAPLPPAFYNAGFWQPCPSCGASEQVDLFPAALRPPARPEAGETLLVEGEASCFYHPAKKAVTPCASCGRFLCALCDIELNGEHLCPSCVESGRRKGKLQQLENRRTLYDNLALTIAVAPILFVWTTILGAPIALYFAIRYWNAPRSIVSRTRWRAVLAIIIALVEIGVWGVLAVTVFHQSQR